MSLGIEQGQAPEGVGRGKIILATLRYFSPPNLAQSGHGGNPASKKQKYWLQEPVQAVLLLAGIVLLAEKGIVPTCAIVLLFLSGGIISLLFRNVEFVLKLIIVWLAIKTFI